MSTLDIVQSARNLYGIDADSNFKARNLQYDHRTAGKGLLKTPGRSNIHATISGDGPSLSTAALSARNGKSTITHSARP